MLVQLWIVSTKPNQINNWIQISNCVVQLVWAKYKYGPHCKPFNKYSYILYTFGMSDGRNALKNMYTIASEACSWSPSCDCCPYSLSLSILVEFLVLFTKEIEYGTYIFLDSYALLTNDRACRVCTKYTYIRKLNEYTTTYTGWSGAKEKKTQNRSFRPYIFTEFLF